MPELGDLRLSRKSAESQTKHAGYLLCLFFDPQDGGGIVFEYSVGFRPTTRRSIHRIGQARNQNVGFLLGFFFGLGDGG
jgi:hypothetical protein